MSKVQLSDIAKIVMGQSPKGETCNLVGDGKPLLNGPTEFGDFYPIAKQFTTAGNRFSIKGDILFCVRGSTTGRMNWADREYVLGRGLASIRHKKRNNYNHYLKYLIDTNLDSILKSTSGSTFPNLTSEMLNSFVINVLSDINAKKVNDFLKNIDAKIELNNRINRELEAMAKTLYDYWFVQFDFPAPSPSGRAGEGLPYKSSGGKMMYNAELKREIPVGWEVKPLAKITDVSNESVNPMLTPEKEFKHYSIPTYDASRTYGIEKGIDIRSNKFVVAESDILVSKLNPWFTRVIYPIKEDDLICSTEFVVWRTSNTNIKNYLFMVGKGEHFILHCSQSATGTSNSHKRVNPSVMMRYKVPFNSELIQKFGATINSWIKIGINKQLENQQLSELRDWLLPMLMNGQVTVKEAEERLSMAAEPNVEYKKG